MSSIRIVLADDHILVRAGIRSLLQQIPGVQVVGEADDGRAALQLIEQLKPDIAVLDIAMPELDGLQVTAAVAQRFPETRVAILSMHAEQEYVIQALRAGAAGYLLKGARTSELELAITSIARGETYLSPMASKHVIGGFVQRTPGASDSFQRLTPRQRQVLKLIVEGHSRKEIAEKVNVSVKTIDTYRAQIMEQLGIFDVAGLVRYALKIGLIASDDHVADGGKMKQ